MADNLARQDVYEESWNSKHGPELIDGVVMMSPQPTVNHNHVARNIATIFSNYLEGKRCTPFSDGVKVFLSERDRFVPDGMVVCDPDKIKPKGVYGAPDLVVEIIFPTSASRDRGKKKNAYERAGVREYWIATPESKTLEVYLLRDGRLELDHVYAVIPDGDWEDMTEEELAETKTEFKCSLFDDLTIQVADVFKRVT